ncbi:hypothetical protein Val02_09330 [Virgisporangium aliadipatigenens]|uniref:Bacterial Death-like domain-containing protein n=1 Tax=Virgisporangium aliadipatigenens TaxID=741659 RepID=A0A8J3YGY3_9ACTN|nr:hypothetical protein [Virgisporangium aliadipatigenens]GIJ44047.1 hypothetical protein Val02_09330 [Virgisporangium aliadipatigenens]
MIISINAFDQRGGQFEGPAIITHQGVCHAGIIGDETAPLRLEFHRRIGDSLRWLADYLNVPPESRRRWKPGDESLDLWQWLVERDRLADLSPALRAIGRDDLAVLLDGAHSDSDFHVRVTIDIRVRAAR